MFEEMMVMYEKGKYELSSFWNSIDSVKMAAQASDAIKTAAGTPENANMVKAIEEHRARNTPVQLEAGLFQDTADNLGTQGLTAEPVEISPLDAQGIAPPSIEDPQEETEAVSVDMRGQSEVRGVRNNNPLNIEIGDDWDGLAEEALDTRFATFNDIEHGLRAGARILNTYRENHEVETLSDIIHRWAPPIENDTPAYVKNVSEWSGIPINVKLKVGNNGTTKALLKGMVRQENGKAAADALSDDVFDRALSIAFPE